eukprot:GHVU01021200.1.p1 GENE.GHVU01021200.1~~GHVU01021200.1.p1  ORF type:complete len:129 (+),score=4.47 GHVU01021200.1:256-642(+)
MVVVASTLAQTYGIWRRCPYQWCLTLTAPDSGPEWRAGQPVEPFVGVHRDLISKTNAAWNEEEITLRTYANESFKTYWCRNRITTPAAISGSPLQAENKRAATAKVMHGMPRKPSGAWQVKIHRYAHR